MNFLPKIKKCPTCEGINIFKTNGVSYENEFLSLRGWTLKKKLNCKKCGSKLGYFSNNETKEEKFYWLDLLICEDEFHDKLNKLQSDLVKTKKNKKKSTEIYNEILDIQNKIRASKIKLKVKTKIRNRGMLIRHVY